MKNREERIYDIFRGAMAIQKLAEREGVPFEEVEADIQETIDAIWSNQDSEIRERQARLFPEGKPSPAEFIGRMAGEGSDKNSFRS